MLPIRIRIIRITRTFQTRVCKINPSNDMSTQISGAVASSRALVSQLAAAYPALQAGLSNPYQSPIPAAMSPSLAPNALLQESDLSPTEVARLVSEFER